jgi:hypothetical protein
MPRRLTGTTARTRTARVPIFLLTVAIGLSAVGCNDSPTEPRDPPLVFSGSLTYQGRSSHVFEPSKEGTVTITLVDLTATLVDVSAFYDPSTAVVGLGVGRPDADGVCAISGQTSLGEGDRQLYGLNARRYCATVFDPGNFPQDSTFAYQLRIELPD